MPWASGGAVADTSSTAESGNGAAGSVLGPDDPWPPADALETDPRPPLGALGTDPEPSAVAMGSFRSCTPAFALTAPELKLDDFCMPILQCHCGNPISPSPMSPMLARSGTSLFEQDTLFV